MENKFFSLEELNSLTLDPGHVFFTSDTNFFDVNDEHNDGRFDSWNYLLIEKWNNVVGPDDVVFHLGDFCEGGQSLWESILSRLNGHIYLVLGECDNLSIVRNVSHLFEGVSYQMMVEIKGQEIILNHYPFHFDKDDSRWQLFGHIGSEPDSFEDHMGSMVPNQFDVGISNNDWAPVAFEVVKYRISQQARLYVKRNG